MNHMTDDDLSATYFDRARAEAQQEMRSAGRFKAEFGSGNRRSDLPGRRRALVW
jgi:hypothetical protein